MGNNNSIINISNISNTSNTSNSSRCDDISKDYEYLSCQGSNIFSESDVYKQFNICNDTSKLSNDDDDKDYYIDQLISMFALKDIENESALSITSLQSSITTEETREFIRVIQSRETLLLRIYNAYDRYQESNSLKLKESNESSVIRTFSNNMNKNKDSAMLMVSMSISMSLAIAKASGTMLFPTLAQSIITLLKLTDIGSISQYYESSSIMRQTIQNIFEYAKDVASTSSGEIRSIALGVMLQIAALSGSVPLCISVARDLYRGDEALPEQGEFNCTQTLSDFQSIEYDYSIEFSKSNEMEGFVARLPTLKEEQKALIFNLPSCSNVAADAKALYTWDSFSMTLYRIGSYNSTAGDVLMVNSQVEAQIGSFLSIDIDEYKKQWLMKEKSSSSSETPLEEQGVIHDPSMSGNVHEGNSSNDNDDEYEDDDDDNEEDDDDNDDYHDDEEEEDDEEDDDDDNEDDDDEGEEPDEDSDLLIAPQNRIQDDSHNETNSAQHQKSDTIFFPASIAVCKGKLYLRMQYLLGERRLAVFNCLTLELESIEEIAAASNESISENYIYECIDSEPIDIRLVPNSGFLLNIIEATYHDQDVTDVIRGLIRDGSKLYISSIPECLIDPSPGTIKYVKIVCNLQSKPDGTFNFDETISGSHILSNLTSDGQRLMLIKRNESGDIRKSLIFSGIKDVQIHSAYCQSTNNENVNVTNIIKKLWLEYLESEKKEEYTVNNELFTDMEVGMTKYLSINYSIKAGETITSNFVENSKFSFYNMFVAAMYKNDDNNNNVSLEALIVDPSRNMLIEKSIVLAAVPIEPKAFSNLQMFFVGNKLIIQQLRIRSPSSNYVNAVLFGFSLRDGSCKRRSDRRYYKKSGYPFGLCYEPINKIIWSFDTIQLNIRKWINNENVPHVYEPKNTDPYALLNSLSPEYRLLGLNSIDHEQKNKFQAAIILCSLDKLSEPYRPLTHEIILADSEIQNEVLLVGEGSSKGGDTRVLIKIRGKNIFNREKEKITGYFIVTLDSSFTVQSTRSFPTNSTGTDRMADFLSSLTSGCLVCLVAIFGADIEDGGSRDSANQLKSLGATKVNELKKNSVYCLIGAKGCTVGFAIESYETDKVCTVRHRLPPLQIPMRVDCSFQNISTLITTCLDILQDFNVDNVYNRVMLLSLLQILSGNIYHLLQGDGDKEFIKQWNDEQKDSLKKVLVQVVNGLDVMGNEIFQCGRNLFLISLKLVYPSPQEKRELLMKYLVEHDLKSPECKILEPLLNRMSNLDEILTLIETDYKLHDSTLSLIEKELVAIFRKENNNGHSLLEAAVRFMYSLTKFSICKTMKSVTPNRDADTQVISMTMKLITFCDKIMLFVFEGGFDWKDADGILRKSLVGNMLPVISLISLIFKSKEILQKDHKCVADLIDGLLNFRTTLNKIFTLIPTESINTKVQSSVVITQEKVFESEHPYASNLDEKTLISFPGACKITITFDPESKTENGCDYIVFKDVETNATYGLKYSGRNSRENFPGTGGRPSLEIFSDKVYMVFHSDGGIEDWGYKLTALGHINQNLKAATHWIVSLDNAIAQSITAYATTLLHGVSRNNLEDLHSVWMEDKLLIKPELFQGSLGSSEIDKVLVDLTDRPTDSLAESLVSIMKKCVPEDQGKYNIISRAVYATCACIIKYNDLGEEALKIAKGGEVSDKFFKAWQNGQKIRQFFKQSTSADEEVLITTTNEIISKALFLLRTQSEEKINSTIGDPTINPLSLISPDLLEKSHQEKPSQVSPRSPRFQKATENKEINISERIISFLQSNVKIEELVAINKIRNVRALFRSKGVYMIQKSLSCTESSISPFASIYLIQSLSDQIRQFKQSSHHPRIHYDLNTEGCSLHISELLSSNYGKYLQRLTELLAVAYNFMNNDDSISMEKQLEWKNVALQIISALSINYNLSDHKELNNSNFVSVLEKILRCRKYEDITRGAEDLLKIVVASCFKAEQVSEFSVKIASFIARNFIEVNNVLEQMSSFSLLYPVITEEQTIVTRIIHGIKSIQSESVGYSFPLLEIKDDPNFSISMLIMRKRSQLIDCDDLSIPSVKVGSKVMKTLQLLNNNNDVNLIGSVTSIREGELHVDWENGKKGKYKYSNQYDDGNNAQEVSIVDPSISGTVFVKALTSRVEESIETVTYFGLQILPNALISVFFVKGKQVFEFNSSSKLPCDQPLSVTVTIGLNFTLYINGISEASESMETISTTPLFLDESSFFIGQPPSYIATNCSFGIGMSALVANMDLYSKELDGATVSKIYEGYPELKSMYATDMSHYYDDINNLGMLSVVRICCMRNDFKNQLMIAKNIATTALSIYKTGGPLQKIGALKICKLVFPSLNESDIGELAVEGSSIIYYFINEMGRLSGYSYKKLQECEELRNAIAIEISCLIACLADTNSYWKALVSKEFTVCMQMALTAISTIAGLAYKEMEGENDLRTKHDVQNIDLIYGTLHLLGANATSMIPGTKCTYSTSTAFGETGYIILSCIDEQESEVTSSDRAYGNHYLVYSLTTKKILSVPYANASPMSENSNNSLSSNFLQNEVDTTLLVQFFSAITALDINEKRKIRLPLKEYHFVTKSFESSHPYTNTIDTNQFVSFPGAEFIEIKFSSQTSLDPRTDYVVLYKNNLSVDYFGEKYTGKRGESNVPGIMGRKSLIIPASSFYLHFHSESSTNNWGYSFTASATCLKQTIVPPPLPPLYYCSINQFNKVVGLQALQSCLLKCSWLLASMSTITKFLLTTALSPVPKVQIPKLIEPLVIESNHPYEHNLDVYFPVKIKGAKKLSITFDKSTSTEGGCDFVRLFDDFTRSTTIPNADQLSGGKNGSSSNWPGLDSRPPLIIEGDSFEIFFHSDGSINAWGWKMTVTPIEVDENDSEIDEEYLNIEPDDAYKSCCYLKELLSSTDIKIKDAPSHYQFVTEESPLRNQSYIHVNKYSSNEIFESHQNLEEVVVNRSSWPRGARAMKNISLSVRKEPMPGADIIRIVPVTENDEILAQKEEGDWYNISRINGELMEGWVRRRDKDIEYLVRDSCAEGCIQEIVRLPITFNEKDKETNDNSSYIHLVTKDETTRIPNSRILKLKPDKWHKTFASFACSAAIGYAKSCLTQFPDSITNMSTPSSIQDENVLSDMLSLIHLEFEEEEKSPLYKSDIVSNLKNNFQSPTFQSESSKKEFLLSMLEFALNYLKSFPITELIVPDTKALVKVVESAHPYSDNMDFHWDFRFPLIVKKIMITFDAESATETDNDYIYILDSDRVKRLYKNKIHGRENGEQHWPGVGNTPPVILQGNSCVIHMITDSGVVDWGFKAKIHGILEEPTEDEIANYKANREERKKSTKFGYVCCWILDTLMVSSDQDIQHKLYSPETVRLLQRFFLSPDCDAIAIKVVQFLIRFIQNLQNVKLTSPYKLFLEIDSLKFNLIEMTTGTYESDNLRPSPFQQSLYELITVITACNYKCSKNDTISDEVAIPVRYGHPQLMSTDMTALNVSFEGYRIWSVKILKFASDAPFIGFVGTKLICGWGKGRLFFGDNDSIGIPFGPKVKPNDIISVHLNFFKGEVAFYRNGGFVGLAVGKKGSHAVYEMTLGNGPFESVCTLYDADDIVDVSHNNICDMYGINATVEKQIHSWLKPLSTFSNFIQLLTNGKIPPLLITNYMLPCFIDHLKVVIDSAETPEKSEYNISIPGAVRIIVIFDESKFHDNDTITIKASNKIYFEKKGFCNDSLSSDLEFNINNIAEFNIRHDDDGIDESIGVGNIVVRSKDFDGDQDGGAGERGVVSSVRDWKGVAGGVNVKWEEKEQTYLHRSSDVIKLSTYDFKSVNKIYLSTENNVMKVIDRDTLSINLDISDDNFERKFKVIAIPEFSVVSALHHASFQEELEKIHQHFLSANTNLYLLLAQYIDTVARKSNMMTSDQLLECPWEQFYANLDEAAQNNISKMFQNNDKESNNNHDSIEENKNSTESYHGPFKGFSLQGIMKDSDAATKNSDIINNDNTKDDSSIDLNITDFKFLSLEEAVTAGKQLYPTCRGITEEDGTFTLRKGNQLIKSSSSEVSYILQDPTSIVSSSSDDDDNQKGDSSTKLMDLESKLGYLKSVQSSYRFLQILNKSFKLSFPLINLNITDGYMLKLITTNRGFLFSIIKDELFESALSSDNSNNSTTDKNTFELRLSRSRARKFARLGVSDVDGQWSIFSQAFRVIHVMPSYQLRKSERLYSTIFVGEHAVDSGGPYRESFQLYMQDLQSDMLHLLIRVNNGKDNIGLNRDKWIPNPDASSKLDTEMFRFLGKLMGIAIRSKEYLSLNFPSIVWKKFINETVTIDDLEAIDITKAKCIKMMRDIDEKDFTYISDMPYITQSASGRTVELIPNGINTLVSYEHKKQFCDQMLQYHLSEFDQQIDQIKLGLGEIIPIHLLALFSHEEVERMICGKVSIDVILLKECTEYSGCSENDDHIKLFWQVMEEFTQEERSSFIRFTWGRSRLPLNKSDFTQKLKIQSFHKSPADLFLPVSHTCFFSIELPQYSSIDIMKKKLLYAISNCISIDGDNLIDNDQGRLTFEDE